MGAYTRVEIAVGAFVLLGLAAVGWLSVSLGALDVLPEEKIPIYARFASVGALKEGAPVKLAGVRIGEVEAIALEDYAAEVRMTVRASLELPQDTIASIRTEGLLGEAFISLSPGAAEQNLAAGGRITQTEPAVDLIDLLSRYAFGSVGEDGGAAEDAGPSPFGDPLQ